MFPSGMGDVIASWLVMALVIAFSLGLLGALALMWLWPRLPSIQLVW